MSSNSAASAPTTPYKERSQREILIIMGALMLGMLLAALDQTIVSTALPTIAGDLNGLDHISWVVTAYLVATTVTTPLYGKLSDLFGRKPLFIIAIGVFLVGSVFAGIAQNMGELVAFRFVQGAGAGGLMVLAMTIIADVVPARQRGKYQGYVGSLFAVSSVIGPLLGGFFTDHLSWRWVFYVNIPIGALALFAVITTLHLPHQRVAHKIDWTGATLLTAGVGAFLLAVTWGGAEYPWGSWQVIGTGVLGLAILALFANVEGRAEEPIIPLRLFRNPVVLIASLSSAVIGFAMFASIVYLPLFLQVVSGRTATSSGLQLVPLMIGLLGTTIIVGRRITATGKYKRYPLGGTVAIAVALFLMSTLDADTHDWQINAYMVLLGAGLGSAMQVLILAAQNSVERTELGVATGLTTFTRSMGGSLGVALGGAVLSNRLPHFLGEAFPGGLQVSAKSLSGRPEQILALPADVRDKVIGAFSNALDDVFLLGVPFAIIAFFLVLRLKELPLSDSTAHKGKETPADGVDVHDLADGGADTIGIATH
ncbi:MAG: drug resistance transporter, EmrB/QacA subfamily [Thermoleophilia bacterium]|nr:drug resistance transporter, EmrB/QacA subfamily [Thermoleophilia bacterium]